MIPAHDKKTSPPAETAHPWNDLILGTTHGQLLRAVHIPTKALHSHLGTLQRVLVRYLQQDPGWGGGLDYFEWRGLSLNHGEEDDFVVDGDLLQAFLSLSPAEQQSIWRTMDTESSSYLPFSSQEDSSKALTWVLEFLEALA